MLKRWAFWFGIAFLLAGILGYIPGFAPNGYLLGILQVDGPHNLIHLVTGIAAVWVSYTTERASQRFFQIFGIIYAVIAVLGLLYGQRELLGVVAHNWADFWFHLIVAALALYLGYGTRRRTYPAHA